MNNTFQTESFETPEEFIGALSRLNARWHPEPRSWIFRGQRDAKWHLTPMAFRKGSRFYYGAGSFGGARRKHMWQVTAEANVVLLFAKAADEQGLPVPVDVAGSWRDINETVKAAALGGDPWPPTDLLPLVALAQHYGLPTRLLDWSRNPLIAAYFAAKGGACRPKNRPHGSETESISVWAFNAQSVSWKKIWNGEDLRPTIVTAPRASNENLRAQQGVFTLIAQSEIDPGGPGALPPLDEVVIRQAQRLAHKDLKACTLPVLIRMDLDVAHSGHLLRLLRDEFVSAIQLFPGYGGVVEGILESERWDKGDLKSWTTLF